MIEGYELINREEGNYPISSMCRWSKVSRSGYYSWRDRPQSATSMRREEMTALVKAEFEASDGTYGHRRITARLERRGVVVHHDTVRSIMRQAGLVAAQPRRKTRTTVPAADLEGRPDLVERDFTATAPGVKWVGDITYIRTWVGFVCLATVLDCATRKVVGYAMVDHMRASLVCDAIDMAVSDCPSIRGTTIFTPPGVRSALLKDSLSTWMLIVFACRWAGPGCAGTTPGPNHAMLFDAALKNERAHRMVYPTRGKAMNDIVSWLELVYNHTRLHSSLGYHAPNGPVKFFV